MSTAAHMYTKLEDIQQGEELLESLMAYFRKVFLTIQINEYSIEAVQPHKTILKRKKSEYSNSIQTIYQKNRIQN